MIIVTEATKQAKVTKSGKLSAKAARQIVYPEHKGKTAASLLV